MDHEVYSRGDIARRLHEPVNPDKPKCPQCRKALYKHALELRCPQHGRISREAIPAPIQPKPYWQRLAEPSTRPRCQNCTEVFNRWTRDYWACEKCGHRQWHDVERMLQVYGKVSIDKGDPFQ